MTRARRPIRPGAALPYHRLAAIALVLAATIPVALLGILVYDQVERSLSSDAIERTDRAVGVAKAGLERAERDLDALVRSYAGWNAFAAQVAAGDLEPVRADVLAFLVEQGAVDGALVITPGGEVAAGPGPLDAAI